MCSVLKRQGYGEGNSLVCVCVCGEGGGGECHGRDRSNVAYISSIFTALSLKSCAWLMNLIIFCMGTFHI